MYLDVTHSDTPQMNIMHTAVLMSGNIYYICLISVLWFFVKMCYNRLNKSNTDGKGTYYA